MVNLIVRNGGTLLEELPLPPPSPALGGPRPSPAAATAAAAAPLPGPLPPHQHPQPHQQQQVQLPDVLIADCAERRTPKLLVALARGVPVLSGRW